MRKPLRPKNSARRVHAIAGPCLGRFLPRSDQGFLRRIVRTRLPETGILGTLAGDSFAFPYRVPPSLNAPWSATPRPHTTLNTPFAAACVGYQRPYLTAAANPMMNAVASANSAAKKQKFRKLRRQFAMSAPHRLLGLMPHKGKLMPKSCLNYGRGSAVQR